MSITIWISGGLTYKLMTFQRADALSASGALWIKS